MNKKAKKAKKALAWILTGAIILSIMTPLLAYSVFADELTDEIEQNQDKLDETNQNKEDLEGQIDAVENQKAGVLEEKAQIDQQILQIEDEIEQLEQQISQKTEEIATKETQIADKTTEIEEKDELFKTRLRVMYEKGQTTYLEVILNAESFSDMFTRIELVKDMATHDQELIEELTNAKNELESLKESLETDKQTLESDKAQADSQKAELEQKSQERDALVAQLQSQQEDLEAAEAELEQEAQNILAEITQLQEEKKQREEEEKRRQEEEERRRQEEAASASSGSSSTGSGNAAYTGGTLGWPSDSSTIITSEFGMRWHPTLHVYKLHTGMDIGASRGTNVLAAEGGEVIKATWSNAYGNYVVIDHGNGMSTLYAHNSKLLVSVGDVVERGQTIAKVGSTGYSTGPHIHIEVIIDGEYQNPADYLY